jgi:hypothetical protein
MAVPGVSTWCYLQFAGTAAQRLGRLLRLKSGRASDA